ncbi:MAG: insulinase family protein [Campylobacterales bacterium]|nr:insulinase family protein [Campylobacterales bacterium]
MATQLNELEYNNIKIPVIYEKHKTLPIFNLQLVFENSGTIKDVKKPGLSNISALLLNEGTKKLGSVEFADLLESKAISISSSAGFETFVIEINCLEEQFEYSIELLAQLLLDPNYTQKTLEKLKTLQISKLQQRESDFDYIASRELKKITYKGTVLENSSSGTVASISSITLDDIKKNISEVLNINNLIISTGGSLQYETIISKLNPVLKILNSNPANHFKKIDFNASSKEVITQKDTQQSYIYFASPFDIEPNSPDSYKSKVASFILGGSGFGSRLMEEIRVKNGLAYSAYGYVTNKKSHSNFTGYLQTKLENTQKAKELVVKIIEEFVQNGVTQKELDAAKKFLLGSEPLRTETFSQRLNRAFMLYYNGLDFDYPQKELDKINSLTLEDLNNFIKSHKEILNLSFSIVTKS